MRTEKFVPGTEAITAPTCDWCGAYMFLVVIEPTEPDHDRRTFKCTTCANEFVETVKFA
jgi:hypothetical protein